ncbi:MAG: gluconokinase [Chloroflexi bacterium]|nr:gluconokinase [Chloroflexota bacterium]
MAPPVIIAVDIGTSGARALVFDTDGRDLAQQRVPYPTHHPYPGWAEQDPDGIVDAVIGVLRSAVDGLADRSALVGVVFCAQMYSVLAVDRAGTPLTPSLTWADMRAVDVITTARPQLRDLPARTGCPLQALYPFAKILWMRQHIDLPSDARFIAIKDYVVMRLTGQLLTDWSTASASGLLDIGQLKWDREALTAAGLDIDHVPPLVSPRHTIRGWAPDVRAQIGLEGDVPLIVGGGDAPLANIGVGATAPGTIAINLGTSAAARAFIHNPLTDPAGRLWTYAADDQRWVLGGIIGSGGVVFEWLLKQALHGVASFAEAEALAGSIAPGAENLLFVPYLSGEQSPGWNARSTGVLFGLTLRHQAAHIMRATMEGIVFALLRAAQPIAQVSTYQLAKIYLTGGLSMSPIWRQVIADVFGTTVVVPASPESSARGAAIIGLMALGLADSYAPFAQPETLLHPNPDNHAAYARYFERFCEVNAQMQAIDHLH